MNHHKRTIFITLIVILLTSIGIILFLKIRSIWPEQHSNNDEASVSTSRSAGYDLRENGLYDIKAGDIDSGITKLVKARDMFSSEKNEKEVQLTQQQIDYATKEKENISQPSDQLYTDESSAGVRY